jgi:hypothetical protein
MFAFARGPDNAPGLLELWVMKADGRVVYRVDESRGLTINVKAANVAIIWLP